MGKGESEILRKKIKGKVSKGEASSSHGSRSGEGRKITTHINSRGWEGDEGQ